MADDIFDFNRATAPEKDTSRIPGATVNFPPDAPGIAALRAQFIKAGSPGGDFGAFASKILPTLGAQGHGLPGQPGLRDDPRAIAGAEGGVLADLQGLAGSGAALGLQEQNSLKLRNEEDLGRRMGLAAALGAKVGTTANGSPGRIGEAAQARQAFDAQLKQAAGEDSKEINDMLLDAGSVEDLQKIQPTGRVGELLNTLKKNGATIPAAIGPQAAQANDQLTVSRLQTLVQRGPQGFSI